jgi:hypothetical protein
LLGFVSFKPNLSGFQTLIDQHFKIADLVGWVELGETQLDQYNHGCCWVSCLNPTYGTTGLTVNPTKKGLRAGVPD